MHKTLSTFPPPRRRALDRVLPRSAEERGFQFTDGANPAGALVQAADGDFYGTTELGGNSYFGTVFKMAKDGTLTTLHSFELADGFYPNSRLLQARDGNFCRTTAYGGKVTVSSGGGVGTVFKITPRGTLTTLYQFCSQVSQLGCTDGAVPYLGLVVGKDGKFYGATWAGGIGDAGTAFKINKGTVFKITPSGVLTRLHSFHGWDGRNPIGGVSQASNGDFYGTTTAGGTHGFATIYRISLTGSQNMQ